MYIYYCRERGLYSPRQGLSTLLLFQLLHRPVCECKLLLCIFYGHIYRERGADEHREGARRETKSITKLPPITFIRRRDPFTFFLFKEAALACRRLCVSCCFSFLHVCLYIFARRIALNFTLFYFFASTIVCFLVRPSPSFVYFIP